MFDVLRALGRDLRDSLRDLTPIVVVIAVFELLVLRQPAARLAPLAGGVVLVVVGLTLFIYGLKLALFPVGENLAHALARKGSVFWLIAFAFALVLGVVRILAGWSLPGMIIGGYLLVVAMTMIAPPDIVGIAYDSGGVTTSTVTVP